MQVLLLETTKTKVRLQQDPQPIEHEVIVEFVLVKSVVFVIF